METNDKLEIHELVTSSYYIFGKNLLTYIKLITIPFVICLAVGIYLLSAELAAEPWIISSMYDALLLLTMIPVVTAWHRLIIVGNAQEAKIHYRFGFEEWLYLRALIVLAIAYAFASLLGMLLIFMFGWLIMSTGIMLLAGLLGFGIFFGVFAIFCRFLLVFPSAAIGKRMEFAESSVALDGNVWRLIIAYVLAIAIPQIILMIFGAPSEILLNYANQAQVLLTVRLVFSLIVEIFFYVLSVGVISYAFKMLIGYPRNPTQLENTVQ